MTDRSRAWLGTILFLLVVPGTVAGVLPWLITRGRLPAWGVAAWFVMPIAMILIGSGVAFLLHAFARFAAQGVGTPAPIAPTRHLVVTGVYRWVRNPMYLSVLAIILGQALLFGSPTLALYAIVVAATVVTFVRHYEEPTLLRTFGTEYDEYRARVPGWVPRCPR